jgi:hypothetical protein
MRGKHLLSLLPNLDTHESLPPQHEPRHWRAPAHFIMILHHDIRDSSTADILPVKTI